MVCYEYGPSRRFDAVDPAYDQTLVWSIQRISHAIRQQTVQTIIAGEPFNCSMTENHCIFSTTTSRLLFNGCFGSCRIDHGHHAKASGLQCPNPIPLPFDLDSRLKKPLPMTNPEAP